MTEMEPKAMHTCSGPPAEHGGVQRSIPQCECAADRPGRDRSPERQSRGGRGMSMRWFVWVIIASGFVMAPAPATAANGPCPGGRNGAGWTLSTDSFAPASTRHAYVGNGYLSQRVPPAGVGCAPTGEK